MVTRLFMQRLTFVSRRKWNKVMSFCVILRGVRCRGFVPLPNFQNFNTLLEGIFAWWSLFGIIWKQKVGTVLFLMLKSLNFLKVLLYAWDVANRRGIFAHQTNFTQSLFYKYKMSKKIYQSDTQPLFPSQCM